MFNAYTIKARFIPTIVWIIPFGIYLYAKNFDFTSIEKFSFWIDNIISIALIVPLYLLSQVLVRSISKIYEDTIFQKWKKMPSIILLLDEDKNLSKEYKKLIKEKIFNDFKIEVKNNSQKISEAMSQIRKVTRDDELLLQHNIEYWFVRNLIWWSLVGFLLCVWFLIWNKYWHGFLENYVLFLNILWSIYIFYTLFWYSLIKYYWFEYAKQLISSYMSKK